MGTRASLGQLASHARRRSNRRILSVYIFAALLVVVGVVIAKAAETRNNDRLDRELALLEDAPVPEGYVLLDSGVRGRGICLKPFGCQTAASSVRWAAPPDADLCKDVQYLVEAWPIQAESRYGVCNTVGTVEGVAVVVGVRESDPVAGGKALTITT